MQMRNLVKEKIEANGYVIGAFVAGGSANFTEILAMNGMDFVIIDMEHAQTSCETAVDMFRAAEMYGMAPMVRVYNPYDGPAMTRLLDVGAHGIMVPLVQDKEQTQMIVDNTKYAPVGKRGANGGRGPRWGNYDNYTKVCNDNVLTIVQCESVKGVENIEEIVSVPGVDGVFIGTGDLSLDMGIQFTASSSVGHSVGSPEMVAAIEKVLNACKANGKIAGIYTATAEDAAMRIKQGFQLVTCMNDLGFFAARTKQHINSVREMVENNK